MEKTASNSYRWKQKMLESGFRRTRISTWSESMDTEGEDIFPAENALMSLPKGQDLGGRIGDILWPLESSWDMYQGVFSSVGRAGQKG